MTKASSSTKAKTTSTAKAKTTKSTASTAKRSTATKKATARKAAPKPAATAKKPASKAASKPAAKVTSKEAEASVAEDTSQAKVAASAPKKAARKSATKTGTKTATSAKASTPPKASATRTKKPTAKKATSKTTTTKASMKSAAAKASPATPSTEAELPEEDEKPKIAPAPMRPALRVAKRAEARRDLNQKFKVDTKIIYPAHGVGYIKEVEKQTIADIDVELFVIDFEHEKMKLRVPVAKAASAGMRNLSSKEQMADALTLLEGRARIKRTMWSRRAQEYEAKINSGDLISVAEVVRDLFRADDQPEQSYSERQLFEQARERLGRELAAVRNYTLEDAIKEIHVHLDRKEKPNTADAP